MLRLSTPSPHPAIHCTLILILSGGLTLLGSAHSSATSLPHPPAPPASISTLAPHPPATLLHDLQHLWTDLQHHFADHPPQPAVHHRIIIILTTLIGLVLLAIIIWQYYWHHQWRILQQTQTALQHANAELQQQIQERRRIEAKLRQSQQQLSALISNIPGYAYIVANDPDYPPEFISEGTQEVTGYDPSDYLIDRTITRRQEIHPDDRDAVWETIQHALAHHHAYECTYRIITKTGEQRWVWERGRGVFDDTGELLNLNGFVTDITQRKVAEEALRLSETRLSLALKAAKAGIWHWQIQCNHVIWSDENFHLLGYAPSSCTPSYENWLNALHPDDHEAIQAQVNKAVQEKSDLYCEFRVQLPDSTVRWIADIGQPTYDTEGNMTGMIGIQMDVTDRKQIEIALHRLNQELETRVQQRTIALREQEERLRLALESAKMGVWDWNITTGEQLWSAQTQAIFGFAPGTFDSSTDAFWQRVHPHDHELIQQAVHHAFQTERYYAEYRIVLPDQTIRWLSAHGKVIYDTDRTPVRMLGVDLDITERKQAETAIQELNQSLAAQNHDLEALVEQRTAELLTFINTLPDYIFVIDRRDMRITFCNDLMTTTTSFHNRHEAQGKTIFECFPPHNANYFAQQNRQVFESGETLHVQETLHLPKGTLYVDTYKIPLKHPNGEVYALIGTSRDISELVQARRALLAQTLQLEATNRELESFSYSVSHDLRAPLRHINGFVNALKQRLEGNLQLNDPKTIHYLEVIHDSSQKMGQLIDGLLTLSRVGRRQMEQSEVDLVPLVHTAIDLIKTDSEITLNPATRFTVGQLPTVEGDPALLQQVFSNLISNAVKFSQTVPTPHIEINSLPDGTIMVKDNGVGFPAEYADQLFGAFQRLHSQQQFKGTGIGLAIVQRIIHRHGGTIWAESQINQGATFYFNLK